jgi:hypothetical protein
MKRRPSGLVYRNSPWLRLIPDGGCLLWPNEYPSCYFNGHTERVARAAWMKAYGPIPDGLEVCHTCDRPHCVYLPHLWLGTQLENVQDMDSKDRRDPVWGYAHRRKLTPEDVALIRSRTVSAYRLWRERYWWLSYSTIKRVANGHTWTAIPRV